MNVNVYTVGALDKRQDAVEVLGSALVRRVRLESPQVLCFGWTSPLLPSSQAGISEFDRPGLLSNQSLAVEPFITFPIRLQILPAGRRDEFQLAVVLWQ